MKKELRRIKEADKKKTNFTIRNILGNPFEGYWPLLNKKDSEQINELLKRLLPLAAIPRGFLLKKQLQQIGHEKVKEKRQSMWKLKKLSITPEQQEQRKIALVIRKSLMLGINKLFSKLEKNEVITCLVAAEIYPAILGKHIVTMAATSGVTVLIVPSLRDTTKNHLGLPCAIFGLNISVSKDREHSFYPLYEMAKKLGASYSPPSDMQNIISSSTCQDEVKVRIKDETPTTSTTTELMTNKVGASYSPPSHMQSISSSTCQDDPNVRIKEETPTTSTSTELMTNKVVNKASYSPPSHVQSINSSACQDNAKVRIKEETPTTSTSTELPSNSVPTNIEFSYLRRNSTQVRCFIPDKPNVEHCLSDALTFIPIECDSDTKTINTTKREQINENYDDEEMDDVDDDDDDEDDIDVDEAISEPGLFFIDRKRNSQDIFSRDNESMNSVTFKQTIVKKVKSNPNKKRKKI